MRQQIAALTARSHGVFNVTFLPAVSSLSDPRVAGWADPKGLDHAKKGFYCTLSHALAMSIAATEELPTVVVEDDVALHDDFGPVVSALLRDVTLDKNAAIQLGYLHRAEGLSPLAPQSIVSCVRVSKNTKHSAETFGPSASDCKHDKSARVFVLGRTSERAPFGTQSYAVTPLHARNAWEARAHVLSNAESLVFIGANGHPYRIDPPLALEDYPRFGSSLGHGGYNAWSYEYTAKRVDVTEYYAPERAGKHKLMAEVAV